MAKRFWKLTHYDDAFDAYHVMEMVKLAAQSKLLLIHDVDDTVQGFIAGIAIPLLGNGNVVQVTELAYWINPEHRGNDGIALLVALEKAAEKVGAKYINMIAMESSAPWQAVAIYEARQYQKIETTYCKELGA